MTEKTTGALAYSHTVIIFMPDLLHHNLQHRLPAAVLSPPNHYAVTVSLKHAG